MIQRKPWITLTLARKSTCDNIFIQAKLCLTSDLKIGQIYYYQWVSG